MTEHESGSSDSGGDGQSNGHRVVDRRRVLQGTAAVSAIGLAGCGGGGGDGGGGDGGGDGGDGGGGSTPTASGGDGGGGDGGSTPTEGGDGGGGGSELPSKEEGIKQWGERINKFCQQAGIDWKQHEGEALVLGMNVHPFTSTTKPLIPYFEELTGINVQFNTFPESQLWQKLTLDLNSETGIFDGFFLGLWPSARYHSAGWVKDLNQYFNDASLTDKDWYAMGDYPESAINNYTYGDNDLVALPFGIEAYGCLAYDVPTFEKLGIDVPDSYPAMRDAAKKIDESDEVDRAGICSRASSTTLSSANWATMHKSYDADWVDYQNKEAVLNSDRGIEALELYAEMMGEYGPSDIGTFDWYKSLNAFGQGNVGMCYANTEGWGVFGAEQSQRTDWIPPVPGPDGTQLASTWEWGAGISQYSSSPEAAWLFLQWATCRPMNLLASTRQWEGSPAYGHARSNWLFDQPDYQDHGQDENWREAASTALDMVPTDPPPVPLHVPQNMDIMTEAAIAMNSAVTDSKSASKALNDAAPKITEFAKEIPDSYL